MSFDILRRAITGLDAWILVLDTRGINVWCAAGKGTFGTQELVQRIQAVGLASYIDHKNIIVPQLGAVGLQAHEVKKQSGFRVLFGPVRAQDIKAYMETGCEATPAMREIRFSMLDRLVLTPMELIQTVRRIWPYILLVFIILGLKAEGILFRPAVHDGFSLAIMLICSILSGAFLTPLALPYIPSASFAVKGFLMGLLPVLFLPVYLHGGITESIYLFLMMMVFCPLYSSYLALNYTGSSTFTSVSGVRKELRIALPVYIAGLIACVVFLILYKIQTWSAV
jgi:hypothetical protein